MKKLVPFLALVMLLSAPVAAESAVQEVQYGINVNPGDARVNTSIAVSCDFYCSGIEWQLPENGEVLFVKNSRGSVDYDVNGNTVSIPGHRADGLEEETYKIGIYISKNPEEVENGLYKWRLSLPSFKDVRTTGFIHAENMISGWIGFGFDYTFSETEMRFRGEGPTNVRVNFGDGQKLEYYEAFGDTMEDTTDPYEISVGTLGVVQSFRRFPVAILEPEKYDRTVNSWSAGEYISGSIRMRDDLEEDFKPILAHETVHGLNDRILRWDATRSTYFDEGTATYLEYLVKKKMYAEEEIDIGPGKLFGDKTEYRVRKGNRWYIYTVPSQGDRERLWDYYQQDMDLMKRWNPNDYPEWRSFGYAYSELIIRNYVANMNGSIRDIYREMDFTQQVDDPQVKWEFYGQFMDMTPCKYDSRERFDQCLDRINSYNYPVYSAKPEFNRKELEINRLEIPNRTRTGPKGSLEAEIGSLRSFVQGFIDWILSFF